MRRTARHDGGVKYKSGGGGARDGDRYMTKPLSDSEIVRIVKWYGRKYGLKEAEAMALLGDTSSAAKVNDRVRAIEAALEAWRMENGWPAENSALSRGKLLALVRRASPRGGGGALVSVKKRVS